MSVLAGDLGGTKTLLMIADKVDGRIVSRFEQRYICADFNDLLPMLQQFLHAAGAHADGVEVACLAVAGPVHSDDGVDVAQITNLPWHLRSDELTTALHFKQLRLINDFQGVGYGIEALTTEDLLCLQDAQAVFHAPRLVVGAGTGFGAGILVWQQDHYEVIASEGGHVDFAAEDAEQDVLLAELRSEFTHVSWERLVSGEGLERLHRFFASRHHTTVNALPAAEISRAALDGRDPIAVAALDLFVRLYGRHTGNLALACVPRGGIFIAGGIAPQLAERLRQGDFLAALTAKGRMNGLLAALPVHLVLNAQVGLFGAVLQALRLQ